MSKAFPVFLLCSALAVPFLGSSNAHAATFVDFDGACLTVLFGNTANRTPIVAIPCFGVLSQKWHWSRLQILGLGTLDWLGTGGVDKCLDVDRGGTADGTLVQLFQCNGTGAQQWKYDNGRIINVRSGKCLDAGDGTNITRARILTCNFALAATGQRWSVR